MSQASIDGGSIVSIDGINLTATFVDKNGKKHTYTATISPTVPPFSALNAKASYDKESDLSGTHTYNGSVGSTEVTLNLANKVVLKGTLTNPITPANTVVGGGSWNTTL